MCAHDEQIQPTRAAPPSTPQDAEKLPVTVWNKSQVCSRVSSDPFHVLPRRRRHLNEVQAISQPTKVQVQVRLRLCLVADQQEDLTALSECVFHQEAYIVEAMTSPIEFNEQCTHLYRLLVDDHVISRGCDHVIPQVLALR
jgi:hypothetical protein